MLTISIIGSGALARSLYEAIRLERSLSFLGVYARNQNDADFFKGYWRQDFQELFGADILLLAVPDHALAKYYELLEAYSGVLAHCSGATELQKREHQMSAVFYPLNSFNKEKVTSLQETPLFIEANTDKALTLIEKLGTTLSNRVHRLNSPKRLALHLAAVISQNFNNHLYAQTQQWCRQNDIEFNWLAPMLNVNFNRVFEGDASALQSGPALRHDEKTLNQHRDLLEGHVSLLEIYEVLTNSIQKFHEKEL